MDSLALPFAENVVVLASQTHSCCYIVVVERLVFLHDPEDFRRGLYPWKVLSSQAVFRLGARLKAALPSPIGSRMIG